MSKLVFEKDYDDESLLDLIQDIYYTFDEENNPNAVILPKDEYGFTSGTFKVTIEWIA